MTSSKYTIRVFIEDLVRLETRLPLQAPALSTSGPIKVGVLRVIHTAPAGCQMIVSFKGDEAEYVLSLGYRPYTLY
jgi:hypothetical protein